MHYFTQDSLFVNQHLAQYFKLIKKAAKKQTIVVKVLCYLAIFQIFL